jgi:hypothetical protein
MKSSVASIHKSLIAGALLGAVAMPPAAGADELRAAVTHARRSFETTTQGPPWPPSTLTDVHGDFVVVGSVLTQIAPGVIVPVPRQAALVSKNTVPPLNGGVEDFSNPFGAAYQLVRALDLRPGSADLAMVLHTPSFGPPRGSFGGGPRIPMTGDSPYNLNMVPDTCADLFPGASQSAVFKRPSFPLHEYPIPGFQGDQVAYDADTGEPYDPHASSGPGCGAGCPGENDVDRRRSTPITLGEWLRARGEVDFRLTRYNAAAGGFTAARVEVRLRGLLPHSVYTAWGIRENVLSQGRQPAPLALPGLVVTDERGTASLVTEIPNPFPARAGDVRGLRLVGIEISYHPDYQNWGACAERFGVGYRALRWFDILPDGSRDLDDLRTVPAP